MSDRHPAVMVIGPTPPPFHGPAVNTKALLDSAIINRSLNLVYLDTTDRRSIANIGKIDWVNIWLAIKHGLAFTVKLAHQKPAIVYLPISQNVLGFLRDSLFLLPTILTGKKAILHLRGGYFRDFFDSAPAPLKLFIRYILAHTARVIVLGNNLRYIFEGLLPDERIVVIPNGLDPGPLEQADTRPQGRHRDGLQITYLGNLIEAKGYQHVLEATPLVLAQAPDARFVLAGAFYRPDSAMRAEQFIQQHDLQSTVSLPGVVTGAAKFQLLRESDIFVFPTEYPYEGHPMVILEAMAAGLPVITTDQGAIRETVLDGMNGFIVPKGDPKAIAEKILLLARDRDLRLQMGQASRERFRDCYTLARWSNAMLQVFQEVLEER